jgi:hypothetical protein
MSISCHRSEVFYHFVGERGPELHLCEASLRTLTSSERIALPMRHSFTVERESQSEK